MPENNVAEREYLIPQLGVHISGRLMHSILDQVFKVYDGGTPAILNLRRVIAQEINIPGFRRGKADRALIAQIRAFMRDRICDPHLQMAVMQAWLEQNPTLESRCSDRLDGHPEIVEAYRTKGADLSAMIDSLTSEIEQNNPGLEREEIEVTLHLVLREKMKEKPGMAKDNKRSEEENGQPWQETLEQIKTIPAEDPRWVHVEEFITVLRELAAQKMEEANQGSQRRELGELLAQTKEQLITWSNYLEVTGVENWQASTPEKDRVGEAKTSLADLLTVLRQLEEMKSFQPATRAERNNAEKTRQQLEEKAVALFQKLDNLLGTGSNAGTDSQVGSYESPATEKSKAQEETESAPTQQQPDPAENLPATPDVVLEEDAPPALVAETKQMDELPDESPTESMSAEPEGDKSLPENQSSLEENLVKLEGEEVVSVAVDSPDKMDEVEIQEEEEKEEKADESDGEELVEEKPSAPLPVPPSKNRESKGRSQTTPECSAEERLLEYLQGKDFSRAYWLAWGLEMSQETPPVPSWLIAAIQGAYWSLGTWPRQSTILVDSLEELTRPAEHDLDVTQPMEVDLGLAAGLVLGLLYPGKGWENLWVDESQLREVPALQQLVKMLQNSPGLGLDPNLVEVIVNADGLENRVEQLSRATREWLEKARARRISFLRAQQVWQEWVHPMRGEITRLLAPVIEDKRSMAEDILKTIKSWRDHGWLERRIQEMDQRITQATKRRPIVGVPRDQMISWINDACDLAEQWAHTTIQCQMAEAAGKNWIYDQTEQLCKNLHVFLGKALSELEERKESIFLNQRISAAILSELLSGLDEVITPGEKNRLSKFGTPPFLNMAGEQPEMERMETNLACSLAYYPEIALYDSGLPRPETTSKLVEVLTQFPERTCQDAIEDWILNHDYRFVGWLISQCNDPSDWDARIREAYQSDTQDFRQNEIDPTIVAIEQALLDGLISESGHTEFRSRVESIRKPLQQSGREGLQPINLLELSIRLQKIRDELNKPRDDRMISLRKHWEEISRNLPRTLAHQDPKLETLIKSVVIKALEERDLRSVGEYLAHLDEVGSGIRELDVSLFESRKSDDQDVLYRFQQDLPDLMTFLSRSKPERTIALLDRDDVNLPGISIKDFPKPRRGEMRKALDAWYRLKDHNIINERDLAENVRIVMEFLGFFFTSSNPINPISMPEGNSNFDHWRMSASVRDASPVAQFGSLQRGIYNIIGVWERVGFDIISSQIGSVMRQTGNSPTIVLYFGRLGVRERKNLLGIARKDQLPMLVIDEVLLFSLVKETGSRLRPMFSCTLPYAYINPYFPTGLVPPEIFKGRRDYVKRLIDPKGPAIIFGGRQLGKSALLRTVEYEFHRPEMGQYAIYEDIRSVGDKVSGKNYQVDLIERLTLAFRSKIRDLPKGITDFDKILHTLLQLLIDKNLRVILLLDEADHFLDADAEKNFLMLQKFKSLMEQSGNRFKLVIAGLHNVQRFQRLPNQPLAHLDTPIEIGPLEPVAARDLLVDPLHALGFRFGSVEHEDISLVLQILSYTNNHPGLIQLFGKFLVDYMLNKPATTLPPYVITRKDVEEVYRKKNVRDAIRDRFNWTLALDPRYEAIVLALILKQWDDKNGFDRRYTPSELLAITVEWWPEAFTEEVTIDVFKGFLEEMRGLGVLTAVDNSRYLLRSPNLVHLMGTQDEIIDRMAALSASTPPGKLAMDSCHAVLSPDAFSPFTFAQEKLVDPQQSGVVLVFGSKALGLYDVAQGVKRLLPEGSGKAEEIHIAAQTGSAIKLQLDELLQRNQSVRYLIAIRELGGTLAEIQDQMDTAIRYCRQLRGKNTLNIIFTLDPQIAWLWMSQDRATRERLEEQAKVVLHLQKWDHLAIKARLELKSNDGHEVIVPERLLNKIMDITNGWPILLDDLFSQLKGDDLSRKVEVYRSELDLPGSVRRSSMIRSLEIFDSLPLSVVDALKNKGIIDLINDNQPPYEVLSQVMEDITRDQVDSVLEYLWRMSIISREPISLDPVIARLWTDD